MLTVSKTLALSDFILKLFHISILRSSVWALSSLPTELANSQTSAFKLFKKIHRPIQWADNLRSRIIGPLSPWGDRPIQRAAAYTDGPPFARPQVGRANPLGHYARGPITPCGLAAGGAVFIRARVPNLTGTTASHYGLVEVQLPHSSDRQYLITL